MRNTCIPNLILCSTVIILKLRGLYLFFRLQFMCYPSHKTRLQKLNLSLSEIRQILRQLRLQQLEAVDLERLINLQIAALFRLFNPQNPAQITFGSIEPNE